PHELCDQAAIALLDLAELGTATGLERNDRDHVLGVIAIVHDRFVEVIAGEDVDPEPNSLLEFRGKREVAPEREPWRLRTGRSSRCRNPGRHHNHHQKQPRAAPKELPSHRLLRRGCGAVNQEGRSDSTENRWSSDNIRLSRTRPRRKPAGRASWRERE